MISVSAAMVNRLYGFVCGEELVVPSLLSVEMLVLERIGQWEDGVKTLYTLEDTPPWYSSRELRQL